MASRRPTDNRPVTPPLRELARVTFRLLWPGDNPSMTVLREGKRRGPNSEPLVRSFGNARTCAADGCATQLSRYNPAHCCYLHHDWDVLTRARPRIILWWTRRVRLWRRVGCGRGVGARGDHGAVAPVVRPWRVRGTPLMATGVRPQLERASVPELPGAHRPGRSGPRGIVG